MKDFIFIFFGICAFSITLIGVVIGEQTKNVEAYLRQSCEIVWETKPYNVNSCITRTMAALGTNDQLRDNELKRLLISSEKALEKCLGENNGEKK